MLGSRVALYTGQKALQQNMQYNRNGSIACEIYGPKTQSRFSFPFGSTVFTLSPFEFENHIFCARQNIS